MLALGRGLILAESFGATVSTPQVSLRGHFEHLRRHERFASPNLDGPIARHHLPVLSERPPQVAGLASSALPFVRRPEVAHASGGIHEPDFREPPHTSVGDSSIGNCIIELEADTKCLASFGYDLRRGVAASKPNPPASIPSDSRGVRRDLSRVVGNLARPQDTY